MGELTAQIDLPLGDPAVAAGRSAIRSILGSWGLADNEWLYDAQVVVSELITNAVRHGGGCLELALKMHDKIVVVSVADGSAVVPETREPSDDGGRGLILIDALSDAWGVEDYHGGKRVWVRLTVPPGERINMRT